MKNADLYEKIIMYDEKFPIKMRRIVHDTIQVNSPIFSEHWHEYLELWYLVRGDVVISHGGRACHIMPGDLAIANSNELHSGYTLASELEYFCIIIDPGFFSTELSKGHFIFENIVSKDLFVKSKLEDMFEEYSNHKVGFDLAIKSKIYELLTYLVRNHIKCRISEEEYLARTGKMARIAPVVQYIENNYNCEISYEQLAKMINVSKYHFCHIFKEATGKTVVEYINDIRLDKAYILLKNSDMNITQVSMSVGFNDMNYFSRIFRKKKKIAPSKVRFV